jgi:hypothetical protein
MATPSEKTRKRPGLLTRYVGGLLGEDVEGMSENDLRKFRQEALLSAISGLGGGVGLLGGLGQMAQRKTARQEMEEQQRRLGAARQAEGQISGRLYGGLPTSTAPGAMGADDGLTGVSVQSPYRRDPTGAAALAGTAAGLDAMKINPMLGEILKGQIGQQVVGGSIYDRETGQFITPPKDQVKTLTASEVKKLGLPAGSIVQQDAEGRISILRNPAAEASAKGPSFGDESGLRKEWNQLTSPYREIGSMWSKVLEAGVNPTPANDIALIFGYMKILDPGSVVREGEFATAQNAGNIDSKVRSRYNQLLGGGELLTSEQRAIFLKSAYGIVKSQVPQLNSLQTQYSNIANSRGIDPRMVITDPFQGAILPKVRGEDDPNYNAIPVGGLYEGPDGNIRRKGGAQ